MKRIAQFSIERPLYAWLLILFALVSSLVVVPLGVYWGTLVAVAVAGAYLACVATAMWRIQAARVKTETRTAT